MNPLIPLIIVLSLVFGCSPGVQVQKPTKEIALSPVQVVQLFHEAYGTARMDEIGPYTTARFREDRPVTVWIIDLWDEMEDLEYRKLDFRIVESKIDPDGDTATVLTHTRMETIDGETEQDEVFILLLENGTWKIDELFVTDEMVPKTEKGL